MNAINRLRFRLVHDRARELATAAVWRAPEGMVVEIKPATRTLDQSAKFHAMLADIVKSGFTHEGRRFDTEDLKTMFVSAWLIETGRRSDVVKGFAGEPVQLRRSTTTFSKAEMGELIDLVETFAAERGIALRGMA